MVLTDADKMTKVVEMQSEMAEDVMKECKTTMMEKGIVPGAVIGFDVYGECVCSLPFGWENAEDRQSVLAMLKILMLIRNVVLYTICHEAWAKSYKPEDYPKEHKWGDLEKEADKEEHISVIVVSPKHVEARACKILRGEDKKVTGFEDVPKNIYTDGDLTRLIPWSKERDERRPA